MRVVLLANFGLRRLGTVRARALPLGRALAERGHDVHLLVPPWDSPHDAGSTWIDGAVRVAHLSAAETSSPLLGAWAMAGSVLRLTPDVVHAFKPIGPGAAALLLMRLRRAATGHGPALVCDADDWEGAGGWNTRRPGTAARALIAAQERLTLRAADAVTAASRTLVEIVGRLRGDDVFWIPNGPNVAAAAPRPARQASECRARVLLYTRFAEFGLERFVHRWAAVARQCPAARLLVVGRGLAGEERQLADLLAARGLRSSALFTGWGAEASIPRYLAASDVALYPCDDTLINRAKSPVKLVELLAAGLPVVAEDVGEVRSYMLDGKAGVLVAPGDDSAFVAAVVALLRDEQARDRLAVAAQAAASQFSWRRQAEAVERVYQKCAGLRARREAEERRSV